MYQDFAKMFDFNSYAQNMQQNMQKLWDASSAMNAGKQNMETMKKVGNIIAETYSTCGEKQMKLAQTTMEDCIESMRELSTAKGVEEYMQKQAQLSQKCAEKAQSAAQDLAAQWQKSQTQCAELMSKQWQQGMEWVKTASAQSGK